MIDGLVMGVFVAGGVGLILMPLALIEIIRLGRTNRQLAERNAAQAAALWTNSRASARDGGWIVGNANADAWRAWGQLGPIWVDDRDQATRYARRIDAEAVHREDEDAWRVEPF